MSKVRVVFQTNRESDLAALQAGTAQARAAEGCIQAEDFRGVEVAENLLHLQLWESAAAWDAYWGGMRDTPEGRRLAELWGGAATPHHHGYRNRPRRTGQNGIEFYKQAQFQPLDGVWTMADPAERADSIRWPAWSAVRILIQGSSDPARDLQAQMGGFVETRAEPGCVQFEAFRGVEFEENTVLVETWETPEIYDRHWMQRLVQAQVRAASGAAAHRPAPLPRRYGQNGFEWYPLCYYALVGDIWEPERPELRMATVHW